MRKLIAVIPFIFCSFITTAQTQALTEQQISAILAHKDRPAEDVKRDNARLPDKVLAFADITPGQHVLDIFAGGGWYSELFSRGVGATGKVYVQNDEVIWRFAEKPMEERTKNNRLPNLVRFDNMPIADISIPDNSLDTVFTALNYHDLFFTVMERNGTVTKLREGIVDYKSALARIKKAMKTGGKFIIIDHVGLPGSGYQAANKEHRIDPDIVKFQMQEAGFVLIEEAYYLRNPKDDLTTNVFDAAIRGKTDRFIYKFIKK